MLVLTYKNSFLATIVSVLGCALVVLGIVVFVEDFFGAVIFVLMGLALIYWANEISENKAFKKWWKQIKDNDLEPVIAKDLNTAIAVYQKNPQSRTVKKIATLNPSFAEYIEKNIVAKK